MGPPAIRLRQGPATFCPPSFVTNDTDFVTMEAVAEVAKHMRFSFADTRCLFVADLRSMCPLLGDGRGEPATPRNPYTREPLSPLTLARLRRHRAWALRRALPVRHEAPAPASAEQQRRMRAVDLFAHLDELEHYTDADWFLRLDARGHKRLYAELHDIWVHRAELSPSARVALAGRGRLFPQPPQQVWRLPQAAVEALTLDVIETLTTTAAERADRVLGAMYVVTALTLVAPGAREAYPWLHESVAPGVTRAVSPVPWTPRPWGVRAPPDDAAEDTEDDDDEQQEEEQEEEEDHPRHLAGLPPALAAHFASIFGADLMADLFQVVLPPPTPVPWGAPLWGGVQPGVQNPWGGVQNPWVGGVPWGALELELEEGGLEHPWSGTGPSLPPLPVEPPPLSRGTTPPSPRRGTPPSPHRGTPPSPRRGTPTCHGRAPCHHSASRAAAPPKTTSSSWLVKAQVLG